METRRLALADVLTERVEIHTAEPVPMEAYLARPAADEPSVGVIVAHELFGVTAHIRDVCERLAGLGFVALAPDFYHRVSPAAELPHTSAGRDRGFELLGALQRDETLTDAIAAHQYLRDRGCERISMLGLSLGGHIAYLAATALPLRAVIAAYPGWLCDTKIGLGRPDPTVTLTPRIQGRVLLLIGDADHAVSQDDVTTVATALQDAHVKHEVITYPGVPHGFLCDRRDTYSPDAASDAWAQIDAFLEPELQD